MINTFISIIQTRGEVKWNWVWPERDEVSKVDLLDRNFKRRFNRTNPKSELLKRKSKKRLTARFGRIEKVKFWCREMVQILTFCIQESFKWACVKENANENDFCLRLQKCSRLNGAWGVKNKTILTSMHAILGGNRNSGRHTTCALLFSPECSFYDCISTVTVIITKRTFIWVNYIQKKSRKGDSFCCKRKQSRENPW